MGRHSWSINQRSTFVPDPHDKAIPMARAGAEGSQTQHQALEVADEIDALVTAGISTVDIMEREAIYQEFQALMLEHLPYIYIGYLTPPIFVNKRVQNVETFGHCRRAHQLARSLAVGIAFHELWRLWLRPLMTESYLPFSAAEH